MTRPHDERRDVRKRPTKVKTTLQAIRRLLRLRIHPSCTITSHPQDHLFSPPGLAIHIPSLRLILAMRPLQVRNLLLNPRRLQIRQQMHNLPLRHCKSSNPLQTNQLPNQGRMRYQLQKHLRRPTQHQLTCTKPHKICSKPSILGASSSLLRYRNRPPT